jgi:hypothetical protein
VDDIFITPTFRAFCSVVQRSADETPHEAKRHSVQRLHMTLTPGQTAATDPPKTAPGPASINFFDLGTKHGIRETPQKKGLLRR